MQEYLGQFLFILVTLNLQRNLSKFKIDSSPNFET